MPLLMATVAGVAYLISARRQLPAAVRIVAVITALALHALTLTSAVAGDGGLRVSVSLALSLMSWQTAVLLWLCSRLAPLEPLRRPVHALACAGLLLALLLPGTGGEVMIEDWRIRLHVILSLLSMGLLTLGALQATLLAVQERFLHTHARGRPTSSALPPLQTMEFLLFAFVGAGFALLSLTLLSGIVFVEDLLAQHLAHKTVLSTLAWAVLGGLMLGRWRSGWRGRTAIRWTLSGYGLLLLAYFGSKFVLEALLGRQWS